MRNLVDEKLLKFIVVGVINTLVGMAIMFGMYNLLGCSYWVSSAANYILASILSYVLNMKFTFDYRGRALGSSIRFIINIAICYLAAYGVAKPLMGWMLTNSSITLQENAAMLTGMCIFTGLNYIGQRLFVFNERNCTEGNMEYKKIYDEWISSPALTEEEKQILKEMPEEDIYEAFYKYAEFGTAGMRGIMGLGTNRLNKYTIRMASKGLAQLLGEGSKVAIAYDTRNNSVEFALETAKVLAASGIKAYLFDRYSPVPLLSFAVRELDCDGGVVITASHNTSEYNGFKVYDNTGSQMGEEMAGMIADNISALADGLSIEVADDNHENIEHIGDDIIDRFHDAIAGCGIELDKNAAEDIKIVYTSLHGSGRDYVLRTLDEAGFKNVILVDEQAEFNGAFPTVKKPNPEDKAAFAIAEKIASEHDADIIIGTDPDCDRIGIGVVDGETVTYFSGNQTGVLLIDFLAKMDIEPAGKKLVTTIVTSDMGRVAAESYGIEVIKTFTGFKNIGAEMNEMKTGEYFMGYEESYGYLPGEHARDKDGVSTALVICQMAAYWKSEDKRLTEVMNDLYKKHGYWIDRQQSFTFEGSAGAAKIAEIMKNFRNEGSKVFTDIAAVDKFLDYSEGIDGFPPANVLKFIFDGGSWIAIRPSGTEPKIKFYYCITAAEEAVAVDMYEKFKTKVEETLR
ncbi:MAG: GtrA family protein [Bacillota bacterium]|nr:GtrA family protein [Bacillota bacterium]